MIVGMGACSCGREPQRVLGATDARAPRAGAAEPVDEPDAASTAVAAAGVASSASMPVSTSDDGEGDGGALG